MGFLCHALGDDCIDGLEIEAVPSPQVNGFARQDLGPIHLVETFQPRGLVGDCADQRVVDVARGADIADDGQSRMQAEPGTKAWATHGTPFVGKVPPCP